MSELLDAVNAIYNELDQIDEQAQRRVVDVMSMYELVAIPADSTELRALVISLGRISALPQSQRKNARQAVGALTGTVGS